MPEPSKPQPLPAAMSEIRSERHSSLGALLEESLRRQRRHAAVIDAGGKLSYGALDRRSRALAAWLLAQGFTGGERIAVMLPNLAPFVVTALAVLRAGLVLVNLDPQLSRRDLVQQLRDSGARAIFAMESASTLLEGALHNAPLDCVVLAREDDFASPLARFIRFWRTPPWRRAPARIAGVVAFAQALAQGGRLRFKPPALQPQAMALLQYSGGTTGAAKAAVLTHRNLVANTLQCIAWARPALTMLPSSVQPTVLVAAPLHGIFGFTLGALVGLRLGATLLLADDGASDLAHRGLNRFVHVVIGTGASLATLARSAAITRGDWAGLRLTVSAGNPIDTDVAALWFARTGCHVSTGYGLAEASPCVSFNPPLAPSLGAGLPLPATDLKLLDDAGRSTSPGAPGEIAVRGPQVMAGYWQRPEETAAVMTPEGYLRTGDYGRIDETGHLVLLDRKKDLIVVGGFRIVPAEIEQVVAQLPGVRECAAVGVHDPRRGQTIKVVVVREDPQSAEPDAAEVQAHCEHYLSGHMRPQVVEFVNALPRTNGGRLLRRELRAA